MLKTIRNITTFILVFALTISYSAVFSNGAAYMESGAKIVRVEYQGIELSKDKNNPTLVPDDIREITIIGNTICAQYYRNDDVFVAYNINDMAGRSTVIFNKNGRVSMYLLEPDAYLVGDDVFEVYWYIQGAKDKDDICTYYEIIPGSESPKYYITFGKGDRDFVSYDIPYGAEPAVMRVEFDGAELSRDEERQTIIPAGGAIRLYGNSACISREIIIQDYTNGVWTRTGWCTYFNSSAITKIEYFAYNTSDNPYLYETLEIAFAYHENDNVEKQISISPSYYVIITDQNSFQDNEPTNKPSHRPEPSPSYIFKPTPSPRPEPSLIPEPSQSPAPSPVPSPAPTEPQADPNDIALINGASPWAVAEIAEAVSLDIIPIEILSDYQTLITRADFCQTVVRMLLVKSGANNSIKRFTDSYRIDMNNEPFSDTSNRFITIAYALRIVNGTGNGLFSPENAISRQEAATMLSRAADVFEFTSSANDPIKFEDEESIAIWAKREVDFVSANGIMNGTGFNMFSPNEFYTREQAILTMLRLFKAFPRDYYPIP